MDILKKCNICLLEFPANSMFFYKDKKYLRSHCKKCSAAIINKWQKSNPEKIKASRARWVEKNPIAARKWASEHPEIMRLASKNWLKRNLEKGSAKTRKRNALKVGNVHQFYTLKQVLEMYGTKCHICNLEIDLNANRRTGKKGWENGLHIDHLKPLSKGGPDSLENVRPAHGICNIKKGAKETATAIPLLENAMMAKQEKR